MVEGIYPFGSLMGLYSFSLFVEERRMKNSMIGSSQEYKELNNIYLPIISWIHNKYIGIYTYIYIFKYWFGRQISFGREKKKTEFL